MSWQVTGAQKFPAVIGEPFGGGFFAGYISHTADGNPTHALIVAPRATGAVGNTYQGSNLKWANETVAVPANLTLIGASSVFDGKANTDLMISLIAAGTYSAGAFPAAQFCANLNIGGFADWYLPARQELDIAYFNLKPSTATNSTLWGTNDYSVPKRAANNRLAYPSQTYVTAFNTSAEAFVADNHWSSTESNNSDARRLSLAGGIQSSISKASIFNLVRAFRRIAL